jgi:hypothetical protein
MPKLGHSPNSIEDGFSEGVYDFVISGAELRTWASGKLGMTVTAECYTDGISFNTWENFTFTPKAMFKLRELCKSVGVNFDNEDLDTNDFLNKRGKATMVRKEGSKYLEVDFWISQEDAQAQAPKSGFSRGAIDRDKVPF